MYKVSILVPIYCAEQYIERCARSLFEQTYKNLEFVFVNDCTKDRSIEVLKRVLEDYPERKDTVIIIDHEKNRGLAAARNAGLTACSGDFIYFVDSDDWLELTAIELLVNKQVDANADIVSGRILTHGLDGVGLLSDCVITDKQQLVLQMMQRTWDHFVASKLVRRSLFVDNRLSWNEGLDAAEDRYMMTLLAYYANGFAHVENVVYHYERRNTNSITNSNDKERRLRNYRQELGNVLMLELFFKDKEIVFQEECARRVMKQLDINRNAALFYFDKKEYDNVISIINGRSDADLELIGWKKKGIRRWMMRHYEVMIFFHVKGRAIRFIKKRMKKLVS